MKSIGLAPARGRGNRNAAYVNQHRPNFFLLALRGGDGLPKPPYLDAPRRKAIVREVYRRAWRQWQSWAAGLLGIGVYLLGYPMGYAICGWLAPKRIDTLAVLFIGFGWFWVLSWVSGAVSARIALPRWHEEFRRQLVKQHVCPACGYDLRATPDRCPECGAEPKGA